jgi:hypothetical protein
MFAVAVFTALLGAGVLVLRLTGVRISRGPHHPLDLTRRSLSSSFAVASVLTWLTIAVSDELDLSGGPAAEATALILSLALTGWWLVETQRPPVTVWKSAARKACPPPPNGTISTFTAEIPPTRSVEPGSGPPAAVYEPGWYSDPWSPPSAEQLRWWDGIQWTDRVTAGSP